VCATNLEHEHIQPLDQALALLRFPQSWVCECICVSVCASVCVCCVYLCICMSVCVCVCVYICMQKRRAVVSEGPVPSNCVSSTFCNRSNVERCTPAHTCGLS
jgi:hypothetical protein